MAQTLEQLETLVRERICSVCSDRKISGECGLEEPSSCALFRLFPQVALAVQSTDSDDIQDYIRAIREQVCSICSEQTSEGECESRLQVNCSLDAYLLPIIDAIEESTGRDFDRTLLVASPNPGPSGWVISP